ncbi:TPA: hypothetical protein DDZ01_04300 [Candidatus Uhrbacteria bacterium]|nr:MAG: Type IV-A pilus assembly ATPase PilB [Candidatus Uhrbacteria bacterium GW2011_GWF2_40_263]HBK35185.1 hypothetical protein [Candidatus Uhrbacteria bacterium]HCB55809.1 hypothetical protein [Candidatus Uhrbacteria bacterium]
MTFDSQSIEDLLHPTEQKEGEETLPDGQSTVEKFEEKMKEVRLKEKETETEGRAKTAGFPYINLKGFPISPEALQLITKEQAEQHGVIPFIYTGTDIRLGSKNPSDEVIKELLYQLQERTKSTSGGIYHISEESFRIGLKAYDLLPKIKKIIKGVNITEENLHRFESEITSYTDIQKVIDQASVSDIMTILLAAGLHFKTSDIHVEAEQQDIAIRFRIDGVLQDVATVHQELWKQMVSRIKLISGLKINVIDKPQDGRFTIYLKSGNTDVRVSTIPTTWGESVVMRLLRPGSIAVEFSQLGYRKNAEQRLIEEMKKPHGMILTTGPTGSGKTTTLYAILRQLNKSDVKIITLEDPIEYKLEGVNQSQIDHTKQYTFATGLRSILRQDPDIVMVGEIRDLETADIAINAALTGHLLLSTLHTNESAGAIPRLLSMGVKPFLLAPAINAIIGQRLVRTIHEDCKEEITLTPEDLEKVKTILANIAENSGETIPPLESLKFFHGKGCEACNHTGYKGRIGIYEILVVNDVIKTALSSDLSEQQMKELAHQQGMVTMTQDGILKALDGITTIEEVFRVIGS